ncbi:MAG: hypothetical protein V4584_05745 [Verrucomicrobiota bacterium]
METPENQIETRGAPLNDVYCRGCHSLPSYKNINTYLCSTCWDRWNQLRRSAEVLEDSAVGDFKKKLTDFIKGLGRYVWHPEVYLYFRPVPNAELKRHCIKVPSICRDLGRFAPADDRIVWELDQRVRGFATNYLKMHKKTPTVREIMAGAGVDHTTLWSMDYAKFIGGLGGKIDTNIRHRFRNDEEFLEAAAQVVRGAGCPLHMTTILEDLGVSYPSYLLHFESVGSEEIHNLAGVSRSHEGVASLLEAAGEKALTELGWEVTRQASFPDLVGEGGRLLHYDFQLVGTTTLVEIDGAQHYDANDTYFKECVRKGDEMKDNYAKRNGYTLIRVDTRIYKSPKSMKEFLIPRVGFKLGQPC